MLFLFLIDRRKVSVSFNDQPSRDDPLSLFFLFCYLKLLDIVSVTILLPYNPELLLDECAICLSEHPKISFFFFSSSSSSSFFLCPYSCCLISFFSDTLLALSLVRVLAHFSLTTLMTIFLEPFLRNSSESSTTIGWKRTNKESLATTICSAHNIH